MSDAKVKIIVAILVLSISLGIYFIFFSAREVLNAPGSGENIIAFGDSLTYGVGSTEGNDYVSVLSRNIGIPIINKGVSGDTTRDALARLQSDVLDHNPKIVIVLLGGNDYLKKIPQAETFSNLEKVIAEIQSTGAAVLLVGIRGGVLADKFENQFDSLARNKKTGYVSDALSGIYLDSRYMSDAVHPNDKGYLELESRIRPELLRIINAK